VLETTQCVFQCVFKSRVSYVNRSTEASTWQCLVCRVQACRATPLKQGLPALPCSMFIFATHVSCSLCTPPKTVQNPLEIHNNLRTACPRLVRAQSAVAFKKQTRFLSECGQPVKVQCI